MAAKVKPSRRIAVVLFNLGGPDGPRAVKPFLFDLLADPAIIRLPAIARYPLAFLISRLRGRSAAANYNIMGGASPLVAETAAQADALCASLAARLPDSPIKVVVAMRYWRPLSSQAAAEVAAFAPDEIVVLPLYPQFSTTTTASSLKAWLDAYKGPGRSRAVCCYPRQPGFIKAHAQRIRAAMAAVPAGIEWRLLFSAHGLPQPVVDGGDPYQKQIEATAAAVAAELGPEIDWRICYQSRVGPTKWLGPYTPQAIEEAAGDGLGVIVTPIAFVSEHVETLVELDHIYADLAAKVGCPAYIRVAALGVEPAFIQGLSDATIEALDRDGGCAPAEGWTCEACGPICLARDGGVRG